MSPPKYELPPGLRPGWSPLPLLSALIESGRNPLGFYSRYWREYGDIVCLQTPMQTILMLNHPDHVKHILVDNVQNYPKPSGLIPLLGKGLLASDGEYWRRQRRMVQPAFHPDRLSALVPMMVDSIQRLLDRWEAHARSGEPLDVPEEMLRFTTSITGRAVFTTDLIEDVPGVRQTLQRILAIQHERAPLALRVLRRIVGLPPAGSKEMRAALDQLDEVLYGLIRKRREASDPGDDMLGMLIAARDPSGQAMNERELRDEAVNIFLAGVETTLSSLTWTWHLLEQNPEVERRLCEEVAAVLGDRPPTLADLPKLGYAQWVFEEALRLYPPAWVIGRQVRNQDRIGPWDVPAGAFVMTFPYLMHRDPKLWDEPERFDPERFSPERSAKRPRFAYFPFGGGQRLCIGRDLTFMKVALLLAMVLQRYRVRAVPGHPVELEPGVVLRPKYGLKATLRRAEPLAAARQTGT